MGEFSFPRLVVFCLLLSSEGYGGEGNRKRKGDPLMLPPPFLLACSRPCSLALPLSSLVGAWGSEREEKEALPPAAPLASFSAFGPLLSFICSPLSFTPTKRYEE